MADIQQENDRSDRQDFSSMMGEPDLSRAFDLEDELSITVRNMRCHLSVIKWVGVLILVATCAVPRPVMNQSTCIYVKQFLLQNNVHATLCYQGGYVFCRFKTIQQQNCHHTRNRSRPNTVVVIKATN